MVAAKKPRRLEVNKAEPNEHNSETPQPEPSHMCGIPL
jgi:hypothetical protein